MMPALENACGFKVGLAALTAHDLPCDMMSDLHASAAYCADRVDATARRAVAATANNADALKVPEAGLIKSARFINE